MPEESSSELLLAPPSSISVGDDGDASSVPFELTDEDSEGTELELRVSKRAIEDDEGFGKKKRV